jgi:hypothetical protein
MCIEAIWGHNQYTLNCVGYDHNWVKQYIYEDDAAPLLPKGTILHIIGFLDTTPENPELTRDALAHALWASQTYERQLYRLPDDGRTGFNAQH